VHSEGPLLAALPLSEHHRLHQIALLAERYLTAAADAAVAATAAMS
jgi:hypothetical protein